MQINLKFNLGDTLWTVEKAAVKTFRLDTVMLSEKYPDRHTYMGRTPDGETIICYEDECFPSKEALTKHLFSEVKE